MVTSKSCQLFFRIYFDLIMNAFCNLNFIFFLIDKLVLYDFEVACSISIISLTISLVQFIVSSSDAHRGFESGMGQTNG